MSDLRVDQPSKFLIWWKAIRPATLWAGAAPVMVGTGIADQQNLSQIVPALVALLGALLIQIGCNLVNDYSDFMSGADDASRLGPARAAQKGWLSVDELKRGAMVSLGMAAMMGVYLTYIAGWPILVLGLLSLVCAVAYTAGPYPLAYLGLGDLFVLLFFGFGAVGGTFFVQALQLSPTLIGWGWSVGALATAILVVNNLRDREGDALAHKRTLAVRFGATWTRVQYTILTLSAFIWPCMCDVWLPIILIPVALLLCVQVWQRDGAELNPLLGKTALLELMFCSLSSASLVWMS